jgi:hypothetical protein
MLRDGRWIVGLTIAAIFTAAVIGFLLIEPTRPQAIPLGAAKDSAPIPAVASSSAAKPHNGVRALRRTTNDATIDAVQQRLEPLARHGDANAASELFRKAMPCYKATSDVATLQSRMNTERDERDRSFGSDGDGTIAAKIEEIEAFKRSDCDLISRDNLAALTRFAAKNAAALGDVDAQLCVIEQRFLEPRTPDLSSDEQINGWNIIADYEKRAFDRGDWRVVSLMIARTLSRGHGPIRARADATPGDPESYLRALQLLRLGATGDYASSIDDAIATFIDTTNPALIEDNRGLSDETIADAKAWAAEQFELHFSKAPPLTEAPIPCGDI